MQSYQIEVVSPEGYTDAFRDADASIMYAFKIGFKNSASIAKNGGRERMMTTSRYVCLLLIPRVLLPLDFHRR